MFNADRKAIGGVIEEVIQWPRKYPKQMEKDAIASIGRGPFLLCNKRAGQKGGRDRVIWELVGGELSKFLSYSFYLLCGTRGAIIYWIRGVE